MFSGKKSGFTAIVGRPNVGKSTLMNQMVETKVAIMSDKPQTTRNRIQGILTEEKGQIIFIDTPGIHKPKSKLGEYMMKVADNALKEVDVILFLVEANQKPGSGEEYIIKRLKEISTPVILVINKIDKVHPEELLPLIDQYKEKMSFTEIVPVSALHGNNVKPLIDAVFKYLPEGPLYYPEDQHTDHPERFIAAELIREKALQLLHEEVPHSIAVVIEEYKERENGHIYIHAVIYCERSSQKGILIGKQGRMLKEIGKRARMDMENLFGTKVFLELWVKVKEDWRNEERLLKNFGFQE
jgi:GTP-binding protein Era